MSEVRLPAEASSWSPVQEFVGSWEVPSLRVPGAALDNANNLVVVWVDSTQSLNVMYLPSSDSPSPMGIPTVLQGNVLGTTPSAIYYQNSFYVFWVNGTTSQLIYAALILSDSNPPKLSLGTPQALNGAYSSGGLQVALGNDRIYVSWRGLTSDEALYFGVLDNKGTWYSWAGFSSLQSPYAPSFGLDPSGGIYGVYTNPNSTLFSISGQAGVPAAPNIPFVSFNIVGQAVTTAGGTITVNGPPALVVMPTSATSATGSLLALFQQGTTLNYITGQYANQGITSWGNEVLFDVPFLPNPAGVLVNTPAPTQAPYALLANRSAAGQTLDNVFWLFEYTGSGSAIG